MDDYDIEYERENQIEAWFEKYSMTEHTEFERIEQKRHIRPDMCAMLYLHEKFGGTGDAVCAAGHDEIWLDWRPADLAILTEADVVYLSRCGVRYDSRVNRFMMFV